MNEWLNEEQDKQYETWSRLQDIKRTKRTDSERRPTAFQLAEFYVLYGECELVKLREEILKDFMKYFDIHEKITFEEGYNGESI